MATKFQIISEVYEREIKMISTPTRWQDFLNSACRNYKCRFDEQLLIFSQRPDATAVLEIEKWNKQFNRWVNKGANGIAVFDKNAQNKRLKYYFDVSDTHEGKYAKQIPIWNYQDDFRDEVIETLESAFGELLNKEDIVTAIFSASENAVHDNLTDYIYDLDHYISSSLLDGTGKEYVNKTYKDLIKNSMAYMLLTRLGFNAKEYISNDDFQGIAEFNTKDTINSLGMATSDITEMALREISSTIISLQTESKNKIHTFVEQPGSEYNVSGNKNERSFENGESNLQQSGRLQSAQLDIATGAGNSPWEVRISSEEILGAKSQNNVDEPINLLQTKRAFDGDRKASLRNDGTDSFTDGNISRSDRTDERNQSTEMGVNDEQYQKRSDRNSDERVDLLLNITLPTVEEQQNNIEKSEVILTSDFSISQEDIDTVLARGSGTEDGKYRIYEQYLKNETLNSNVLFLKKEYGIGGVSPVIREKDLSEMHDSKGIRLTVGSSLSPEAQKTLSWNLVAKRIGELIKLEQYLNEKERLHYPEYIAQEGENKKYMEVGREFSNIIREYNEYVISLEEPEKKLDQYILTDCGSCFGRQEKKTHMRARKGDYILPLMKKAMDNIIAENTSFTHRATAMLDILNSDMALSLQPEGEPIYEYEYHLGDTVYIGANRYEILAFDDNSVQLYDEKFPIFNKELERADFDIKVQENPDNDHLRVIVEENQIDIQKSQVSTDVIEPVKTDTDELDENDIIGKEVTIDNRKYVIESIKSYGDVSMRDITFENVVGFPINRLEKVEYVRSLLYEKENETLTPVFENKPKIKTNSFDLHPEIKEKDRNQYVISDDTLGFGTAKEKFRANVDAITVLKKLESENRFANKIEQEKLAQYVGFGSLADAFDDRKTSWQSEYRELKSLLTDEEYTAAMESTLTAFYTSPIIIRSMYKALENMGMQRGNILEPSCGTGNFIGMLPDSMKGSKLYGVELDSLTGRIAQQLYQKSSIAVQGYESTNLPDSFFDVAIGNVPFGQFKVLDKRYDKLNFLIHDYFFGKTLDKVRPGGIIAFITSKGTLDKENPSVRKYIAQRADLIGAIRLPNNAFKANAGTEVTSDIIFLQKRDRIIDIEPSWAHLGRDENGLLMNQYYIDNPDMILGDMKEISGPFGPETACVPIGNMKLEDLLSDAIYNINATITEYEHEDISDDEDLSIPADPTVRNFSYTIYDGKIYYRENSKMTPVDVSATAESRIKGMIEMRNCVRTLIEYQSEDYPDSDIKTEQNNLNQLYDTFTKKYGTISSRANSMAFSNDSSYALLSSLEIIDENGNLERKADMFTKRTIKPHIAVTSVDTASEALAVSLSEKARVDMEYMSKVLMF